MPIQLSGSLVITGSITTTGVITMSGSIASATSASYSSTSDLLQGTGSVGFATTASLLTVSSSQQQISASQQQISSSLLRISSSYASTGSNTFTGIQNFSNTCTPNSFTAGASIYTAGGLQVTQDTYFSSSVYIKGNVTVYGTQSVSYVSSSQFNIGTNIITVNTFTPSVRYGGLSVFDSGSTGLTGSIFWDSELNRWIYVNASGSGGGDTYGGGMFISGPRNSQGIGCEQGTTACMLLVGQGGDHLTSSLVYHSSTVTCIPNAIVGGSTISGTTIYGSTAVCSAVGKFTTCLDLGGALTGTSATLSGLLTLSSGAGTKAVWATTRNFGVNRNFQIAVDEYAESAFTITPSTTLGGSSYTTPIFTLAAAGAATFACSVQSNYLSSVISSSSNASPLILQNTAGWASSQISSITVKDASSAVGAIGWKYDGAGNVDMLFHSLYNGAYKTTSDVVMTVKGTGNVGIGTTNPSQKLTVTGIINSEENGDYYGVWIQGSCTAGKCSTIGLGPWYSQAGYIQWIDNDRLRIYTCSSGRNLTLQETGGNVGIGTTSPVSLLHVQAANNVVGTIFVKGGKGDVTAVGEINSKLDFGSNDTSVNNDNNIGGRIASVTEYDNGAFVGMAFSTFQQGRSPDLKEAVRITNTGNVGIGTIAPGYKLDVQCGWINNVGAQNASGFRYENSGAGHTITLNANNSYAQLYTTTDTSLYLGANNNLTVKISNTGETCFKCNVHFCSSTYGVMGFGEKVFDKICYIMTTTGTICVPLDGLGYGNVTRAIYLYGTLLDNDAAHYAHILYYYRNDYGGLQACTISQASLVHPSTAGQAYTFSVNDPVGIGKSNCTLNLRFTSSGAGVAPGSYCTKMRIVVYNVPANV